VPGTKLVLVSCFSKSSTRIGDLRILSSGSRILLRHDVFIIDQARGVIQQLADGDCVSVSREVRKDVREMVLVAQLAIVNQQHDRHAVNCLLTEARRKFVSGRSSARFAGRLRIAFSEYRPAFLDYEHRATGIVHVTNSKTGCRCEADLGERRPARKHRHSYREAPIAMPMRSCLGQLFPLPEVRPHATVESSRDVDYVAMPAARANCTQPCCGIRSYSGPRPAAPDR